MVTNIYSYVSFYFDRNIDNIYTNKRFMITTKMR